MNSVVKMKTPTERCTQHPYTILLQNANSQLSTNKETMKKELWSKILHIVITVLTAIATTFGVTSCMGV